MARVDAPVLTSPIMTSNSVMPQPTAPRDRPGLHESVELHAALAERSIVLIGLMGAGKTAIGRRLAARLGLPFHDADAEIELAAGRTVPELFTRFGEPEFRAGERRVIRRLLSGERMVLATGGGAYMDPQTRAAIRATGVSVWLRVALPTLMRRVSGRTNRPLLNGGNPAEVMTRLMAERHPTYAEADLAIDCRDESPEYTTNRVIEALATWHPPRRLAVALSADRYEIIVGDGLLARAGAHLANVLPQKRCVVVTDDTVASLHLPALLEGLDATGIAATHIAIRPGEASKSLETYQTLVDALLEQRIERRTAILALGGGVVGDLAGFAAATTLRGLPFVQLPTTLLAQVDSSVGGKTGINTRHGKNLLGAFHQPHLVLADTATLASLPPRELRAGYAEIAKAGLIGDAQFYDWCEAHAASLLAGDRDAQAEAIFRACAFKAAVVADDEREEKPDGGRALLNLGHSFGHALEAELGYGAILHGEAVGLGLGLAFRLSATLGLCPTTDADRVVAHLASTGLPAELPMLNRRISAAALISHMSRDKKVEDGRLKFILARSIGDAFTSRDVPTDAVIDLLRSAGCTP